MNAKIVRITVEGGVVQHIDVPRGIRVIVADYDVEGCDEDLLKTDQHGDKYAKAIWEHEE